MATVCHGYDVENAVRVSILTIGTLIHDLDIQQFWNIISSLNKNGNKVKIEKMNKI